MECAAMKNGIDWETLLELYLAERRPRPATAETYTKAVKRWVAETNLERIGEIDRSDVVHWRNEILDRARPETWNKYRRHLRALMNYAVECGWVEDNPFAQVPPARTGNRLKKTVDLRVIEQAMKKLDSDPELLPPSWFWTMVIRALFYTGVRRRQIVELRWGDVNLMEGTWLIRTETSKTRREWILPLAPSVCDDLESLYQRTEERLGHPPPRHHQVYNVTLFHSGYKGRRMNENQVSGAFQRLSKILGEPITPHRLRHTMATLLARQGDLRTLQEVLGHTNVQTTMGYVHPDVERMRSLIGSLPSLAW